MTVKIRLWGELSEVEASALLIQRFFHVVAESETLPNKGQNTVRRTLEVRAPDPLSGFSLPVPTSASTTPAPAEPANVPSDEERDAILAELATLTEVYKKALGTTESD